MSCACVMSLFFICRLALGPWFARQAIALCACGYLLNVLLMSFAFTPVRVRACVSRACAQVRVCVYGLRNRVHWRRRRWRRRRVGTISLVVALLHARLDVVGHMSTVDNLFSPSSRALSACVCEPANLMTTMCVCVVLIAIMRLCERARDCTSSRNTHT